MRRVVLVNCLAVALIAVIGVVVGASSTDPGRSLPLPLHTKVTLSGTTLGSGPGQHVKGHVFATAQWNHGARYVVATPRTDRAGQWRADFRPSHRGFHGLPILPPDG